MEFGYDYRRKTLCTVQLRRKLIPFRKSYSLQNLCKELKITNKSRHRAAGDAEATMKIFEFLLSINPDITEVRIKGLNSKLEKEKLHNLPVETGIYYFYNDDKELIYIGKSTNIHSRVMSHLSNNSTKKALEMKDQLTDIDFEITGSELIALLLESDEIKKHKPVYNSLQRRSVFNFGLHHFTDNRGYICLKLERNEADSLPLTSYSSMREGREHLFTLIENHNLCQKLCGLYDTQGACFHHQIRLCKGACIHKESPEEYNKRVLNAVEHYMFQNDTFIIVDKGRNSDERSVVKVKNGKYLGFGYIDYDQLNNRELIDDCINLYNDNRDVQQIIRGYLRSKSYEKLIFDVV